jgi:hypothetical protein
MMKNVYYVYIYLDPNKEGHYHYNNEYLFNYEPFYIGKGKNGRYKSHLNGKSHNKDVRERIKKIKEESNIEPIVFKLKYHLNEEDSLIEERSAIKIIGTVNSKKNKGPLLNKEFSNVYETELYSNNKAVTYILEHPYVVSKEVIVTKHKLIDYCKKRKMSYIDLLNGNQVDGWTLTVI